MRVHDPVTGDLGEHGSRSDRGAPFIRLWNGQLSQGQIQPNGINDEGVRCLLHRTDSQDHRLLRRIEDVHTVDIGLIADAHTPCDGFVFDFIEQAVADGSRQLFGVVELLQPHILGQNDTGRHDRGPPKARAPPRRFHRRTGSLPARNRLQGSAGRQASPVQPPACRFCAIGHRSACQPCRWFPARFPKARPVPIPAPSRLLFPPMPSASIRPFVIPPCCFSGALPPLRKTPPYPVSAQLPVWFRFSGVSEGGQAAFQD